MEQAKRIADGVWGVETVVGVGLGVHLPLRMTVLRVDGGLWLVSPIAIDDALADELSALGEVHALVAPNLLHHAHVEAAKRRYPEARLLGAPGLAAKRPALPWDGAVDTGSLAGDLQGRRIEGADKLSEVVLWHVPSATLVVTDAVFNIPEARGMSWLVLEYLSKALGHVEQSRLLRRLTGDRAATAKSVAAIMEWPMQRVVMAHGDVVTEQAAAELSAGLWWWQGIERRPPVGATGSADQMVRA